MHGGDATRAADVYHCAGPTGEQTGQLIPPVALVVVAVVTVVVAKCRGLVVRCDQCCTTELDKDAGFGTVQMLPNTPFGLSDREAEKPHVGFKNLWHEELKFVIVLELV